MHTLGLSLVIEALLRRVVVIEALLRRVEINLQNERGRRASQNQCIDDVSSRSKLPIEDARICSQKMFKMFANIL
jgi:hypothetical protein